MPSTYKNIRWNSFIQKRERQYILLLLCKTGTSVSLFLLILQNDKCRRLVNDTFNPVKESADGRDLQFVSNSKQNTTKTSLFVFISKCVVEFEYGGKSNNKCNISARQTKLKQYVRPRTKCQFLLRVKKEMRNKKWGERNILRNENGQA